jgi:hypothetical protein
LDSLLIGLGLTAVTILSISGTFAAQIAIARRRNAILWFVYGIALGPVAPVLVWLSPPADCPVCGTATRGWLRRCDACGVNTRQVPAGGPLAGIGHARPWHPAEPMAGHPALLHAPGDMTGVRRAAPDEGAAVAGGLRWGSVPNNRPDPADEPARVAAATGLAGRPASVVTVRSDPPPRPMDRDTRVVRPAAASVSGTSGSGTTDGRPYTALPAPPAPPVKPVTAPPSTGTARRTPDEEGRTSLLATGVFTGGTAGLVVGARYAIVRAGTEFQVLGPLDSAPDSIVLRRPLDELDPLCVTDRCIISHRSQPTRALIAMRGIAGLTGEQLEAGLRPAIRVGEAAS